MEACATSRGLSMILRSKRTGLPSFCYLPVPQVYMPAPEEGQRGKPVACRQSTQAQAASRLLLICLSSQC